MSKEVLRKRLLASSIAMVVAATANVQAQDSAVQEEELIVTGIRASLERAMDVKREAQGVVDAISAEDIGKFPDTNLAESLQRITGVSINRSNGEGQQITVRGFGPQFNLVTLNGRQMPTSELLETSATNSRSFDFSNIAAESVSGVEVYKTARASLPTGGLGATVNIKTARPLDNPGLKMAFGVKAMDDHSSDEGKSLTPEISGIFSQTMADDKVGVALSASYQDREGGFSQAAVPNGWRTFQGDAADWGTIPLAGAAGSERIVNRPDATDIYSVPQNFDYNFAEFQRERINSQLVLQYQPMDSLQLTLDHTMSEQKIATQRNNLSVWFNFGPSSSAWTDGPIAAPLVYQEIIDPAVSDMVMAKGEFATRSKNESVGFNAEFQATDNLSFVFDYHQSTAVARGDSPYGSSAVISMKADIRGTTTVDFSEDFPVLSIQLPEGRERVRASDMVSGGTSLRNSYWQNDIDQLQLSGKWEFDDSVISSIDFGISKTENKIKSQFEVIERPTWGGVGSPADIPDGIFYPDSVTGNLSEVSMVGPISGRALTDYILNWDFDHVARVVGETYGDPTDAAWPCGTVFCVTGRDWDQDRRTAEDITAAYVQANLSFDIAGLASNLVVGVRSESTDVTSSALVPIAVGLSWDSANEYSILYADDQDFTALEGDYSNTLPSLDFDIEVVEDVKVRASYGVSIARADYGSLQGGQTLASVRFDGGTGAQGNPGLLPFESTNLDLSVEWYFAEASYASLGVFRKDVDNWIGQSEVTATPFDLPHPAQGERYAEALAAEGNDLIAIRNYIFEHADPATVNITGTDANGNTTGNIYGVVGEDPAAEFSITVPVNEEEVSVDGLELAVQWAIFDTGFGFQANYTLVDGEADFDKANLTNTQIVLPGLSDSYNIVGFYDKHGFQARLAYNWRDEFFVTEFFGDGRQPLFNEEYGQWDLNVSYDVSDNLTFFLEGLNLTEEYQRVVSRNDRQVVFATEQGARYNVGARYNF